MNLFALQGFLFALANSPEDLALEDWQEVPADLGLIDPGAGNIDITALFTQIRDRTRARQAELPEGMDIVQPPVNNTVPGCDLHAWSHGFMLGYSWLDRIWQAHLPEQLQGNLATTLMVLGFFSSEVLAIKLAAARGDGRDMASVMLEALPGAMAEYVNISRSIAEVLKE